MLGITSFFSKHVTLYTGFIKTQCGELSVVKMTGSTNGWLPTMLVERRGQGQLSVILNYAEYISALFAKLELDRYSSELGA